MNAVQKLDASYYTEMDRKMLCAREIFNLIVIEITQTIEGNRTISELSVLINKYYRYNIYDVNLLKPLIFEFRFMRKSNCFVT